MPRLHSGEWQKKNKSSNFNHTPVFCRQSGSDKKRVGINSFFSFTHVYGCFSRSLEITGRPHHLPLWHVSPGGFHQGLVRQGLPPDDQVLYQRSPTFHRQRCLHHRHPPVQLSGVPHGSRLCRGRGDDHGKRDGGDDGFQYRHHHHFLDCGRIRF